MLKIEKIKEEILNFNHANDALRCYLARVTTKQSNIDGCCRPNLRCEECLKVSFIDLLEEYKKPVKLTKFEYEYLKVAKKRELILLQEIKLTYCMDLKSDLKSVI